MVKKLNYLIERFYDMQKQRQISNNNLIAWVKENISDKNFFYTTEKKYADYAERMVKGKIELSPEVSEQVAYLIKDVREYLSREKEYERELNEELANYDIYTKYLRYLKGVSTRSAAGLIAWIGDIKKFEKPSKLVAYAGLSAEHWKMRCEDNHYLITTSYKNMCPAFVKSSGERDFCGKPIVDSEYHANEPPKATTGYMLCINRKLKTHIMKILGLFDYQKQHKCLFKKILNEYRDYYASKFPDTTRWIIMRKAYRGTANIFVHHLHYVWSKLEGLTPVGPYVFDILGHSDYIPPAVDLKDCPYCGRLNDKDATECKKCHNDISDVEPPIVS